MAVFLYKARDKHGSLFRGTVDTLNKEAVAAQLDGMGYFPVLIEEQRNNVISFDCFSQLQPVTLENLIIFTRQLATLVAAGLPFITSFDALIEQTENKRLKQAITQVRKDVEAGKSFADALGRHPKIFNDLYVNMVK